MVNSSSNEESDRFNPRWTGKRTVVPKIKKPPQRGMGVAELERLRLLERNQTFPEMGSYFRTPFTTDPSPIGVPMNYPPGFGPMGYNPNFVITSNGNVMYPVQYQIPNPYSYGSDCIISNELPSIPSPVYKKKHTDVDQSKEMMGFNLGNENYNKEMVVEHQFFPTKTDLKMKGKMKLGSSAETSIEIPSVSNEDDDHVMVIDLSLKL